MKQQSINLVRSGGKTMLLTIQNPDFIKHTTVLENN
jgi:hypothetical protein